MANVVFWSKKLKKYVTIPLARWEELKKLKKLAVLLFFALPVHGQAIQTKPCVRGTGNGGYILPCSLDKQTTPGNLVVFVGTYGTAVTDSQSNAWKCISVSGYYGGTIICYAMNVAGGYEAAYPVNFYFGILAEYPAVTALDGVAANTYAGPNLDEPPGASNDWAWTFPVETYGTNELLIGWSVLGSWQLYDIHPSHFPVRSNLTIDESEYGFLALGSTVTQGPGLYFGSMKWNSAAHWVMGLAAFRMKGK